MCTPKGTKPRTPVAVEAWRLLVQAQRNQAQGLSGSSGLEPWCDSHRGRKGTRILVQQSQRTQGYTDLGATVKEEPRVHGSWRNSHRGRKGTRILVQQLQRTQGYTDLGATVTEIARVHGSWRNSHRGRKGTRILVQAQRMQGYTNLGVSSEDARVHRSWCTQHHRR